MLGRQPNKPAGVILRFAQLVAKSSPKNRAIWAKAISKEFDIGIQGGFEPTSAEWVLEPNVVNTAARLGAGLRITVYSPDLLQEGSKGRPSKTGDNKRLKRTVEKRPRSAAGR